MGELFHFSADDPILSVADRMERLYWRSSVSVEYQTYAVVGAIAPLILEQSDVPEPFHLSLYGPLRNHLYEVFSGGTANVTEDDITAAINKCNKSMPTLSRIESAMHDTGLLRIGSKHFWAQGLWHYYGQPVPRARSDKQIIESLTQLLARAARASAPGHERTLLLTDTIARWSRGRGYRPARELSLPVITPGSTYFGRSDLVTFRHANNPPLVIEIDSQPNERSAPKLVFARDAGALPVWVRWHIGDADTSQRGVTVIDFCDQPAELAVM